MVVAQKVKEAEITEQDSLLLTRNLLRIAIFNISYIRGLFPEKYFNDKSVPALEMKIKKLMPMDAESRRLIDWMEKGVYDALQKKYLKTLLFCVCESVDGPMLEEYAFSFSYSNSEGQEVSMNVNRIGNKKQGGTFKCNSATEISPSQMRSSACKMVRTLVQLMRTLDRMPDERTILMKLLYYEDVTPIDYEPPFFKSCTEEEAANPWTKSPLRMEVGNVNSKHFVLALKVRSVLDPCEDENEDAQEDVSLGADSFQKDDFSDSDDSENNQSQGNQYVVAPIDNQQAHGDSDMIEDDDPQEPEDEDHQLTSVKEWITSRHCDTVELGDLLSNFPDVSMVFISETMDKLENEGFIAKAGRDTYTLARPKELVYNFDPVKEELDGQNAVALFPLAAFDDSLYIKALYHALPMNYVSVAKLQPKLKGDTTALTIRKLIDKMIEEGYVEAKTCRSKGKRVIRSDRTMQKLLQVQNIIERREMEIDDSQMKCSNQGGGEDDFKNLSTCAALQSIGSDLTRTNLKPGLPPNGSLTPKSGDHGGTPTSRVFEPVASRESFVPGAVAGGTALRPEEAVEHPLFSRSSQDKWPRKTSMVKEPILQFFKRKRTHAT